MKIVFSEASGLNNSVYGNCQAPIQMFLEKRAEAFEQKSVLKDLFCMGTSENFGDLMTGMTAMDGFKPVGESGAYPADGMQEGYQKLLVYETWKDSFAISKEMIEDSKLMNMKKSPAGFMTAYGRTRERFGAALYGGAIQQAKKVSFHGKEFDATGADGQPVFAKDHKAKVKGKAQSNCFSNPFSADALGAAEAAMQNFVGDNEEELDVAPDTIIIPNDHRLKKTVFAAIGADKDPETANNGFNYVFGRWRVICWTYLNRYVDLSAGSLPWILLDSQYNQEYGGAVWNDRVKLEVRSIIDNNTDANKWLGRSRFNATFNDWRFAAVGGITGGTALAET